MSIYINQGQLTKTKPHFIFVSFSMCVRACVCLCVCGFNCGPRGLFSNNPQQHKLIAIHIQHLLEQVLNLILSLLFLSRKIN